MATSSDRSVYFRPETHEETLKLVASVPGCWISPIYGDDGQWQAVIRTPQEVYFATLGDQVVVADGVLRCLRPIEQAREAVIAAAREMSRHFTTHKGGIVSVESNDYERRFDAVRALHDSLTAYDTARTALGAHGEGE